MENLPAERCAIAERLIDLEAQLRQLGLWSDRAPAPEALVSQQPFAVDTLDFSEWLQYVFLPKVYALLERGEPLPESCVIAPMAEESLRGRQLPIAALLEVLQDLDEMISATP